MVVLPAAQRVMAVVEVVMVEAAEVQELELKEAMAVVGLMEEVVAEEALNQKMVLMVLDKVAVTEEMAIYATYMMVPTGIMVEVAVVVQELVVVQEVVVPVAEVIVLILPPLILEQQIQAVAAAVVID